MNSSVSRSERGERSPSSISVILRLMKSFLLVRVGEGGVGSLAVEARREAAGAS